MKSTLCKLAALLFAVVFLFAGCNEFEDAIPDALNSPSQQELLTSAADDYDTPENPHTSTITEKIDQDGEYNDKDNVALYLHTYGHLPSNYITKNEAEKQGWESHKGNLHEALPGMSIGGDHFGNHEGILPQEKGLSYHECDIDYEHGGRNGKRIIYSNKGDIYYTDDHYKTFTKLY